MKPVFELRKVVDPHKHMPEDIKKSFFEGFKEYSASGVKESESYLDWEVGHYLTENEEDDHFFNEDIAKFDRWLLENFDAGENLILLYWW